MAEPLSIVAGDKATWTRQLSDHPASDGWALSYTLVERKTGAAVSFDSTGSGSTHTVSVPSATTAAWPPGFYAGQGYVTKDGERVTIWANTIEVKPNFASGMAGDIRSHARKVVDSIEAVLEGRASQEVLEFNVEGTTLRKTPVADLLQLRDRYMVEVRNEEARDRANMGLANGKRILTHFIRPT
jgi:hypothetical protein